MMKTKRKIRANVKTTQISLRAKSSLRINLIMGQVRGVFVGVDPAIDPLPDPL